MAFTCDSPVEKLEGFRKAPGFEDQAQMRPFVTSEALERDAARMVPTVDRSKCTRCGACVRQCPAGCLEMQDVPAIGAGECAGCHACQEICPSGAMYLD